ncbi:hypothetical protein [Brasilonema sp. UFV-L1]|uniref:hypothetical protein n=1 Tax=Brasilonema sp. UFV-L1 TaxID=2234130 RepID=UPI00145ECF25|nr:hypothetical protein [Brasilonema sp. UFV-L1]
MQSLPIFGETFTPVDWERVLLATTALAQVYLERVLWVPLQNPPHKQGALFEH